MEMQKSETQAVAAVSTKKMSNGRVKLNRVVANFIRMILGKDKVLASVDEMSVDGIFARMQKDKQKLDAIILKQDKAIADREKAAKATANKTDQEVEDLEAQIEIAKENLQVKLAEDAKEKAAIAEEKKRVERVSRRMAEFFE